MEQSIPQSIPPASAQAPAFTPEQVERIKALAKERAMQATLEQAASQPQVVYVRRNLTVAELIVVFAISCGIVFGIQGAWHFATTVLPRIEVKVK